MRKSFPLGLAATISVSASMVGWILKTLFHWQWRKGCAMCRGLRGNLENINILCGRAIFTFVLQGTKYLSTTAFISFVLAEIRSTLVQVTIFTTLVYERGVFTCVIHHAFFPLFSLA